MLRSTGTAGTHPQHALACLSTLQPGDRAPEACIHAAPSWWYAVHLHKASPSARSRASAWQSCATREQLWCAEAQPAQHRPWALKPVIRGGTYPGHARQHKPCTRSCCLRPLELRPWLSRLLRVRQPVLQHSSQLKIYRCMPQCHCLLQGKGCVGAASWVAVLLGCLV